MAITSMRTTAEADAMFSCWRCFPRTLTGRWEHTTDCVVVGPRAPPFGRHERFDEHLHGGTTCSINSTMRISRVCGIVTCLTSVTGPRPRVGRLVELARDVLQRGQ